MNPFSQNAQKCSEGNTKTSEHISKDTRQRAWCGTINNWSQADWDKIQLLGDYGCVAQEVAPTTGTPHMQWYLYFKNKITFGSLKKKLPRSHIKICMGNADENRTYIFGPYDKVQPDGSLKHKDANPTAIEWGDIPSQGARKDLDTLRDRIMNGARVDDIAVENPILFHQYGRTLTKLEDIALRKRFRTEMTKGIWYWGKTGVGKSHRAYENFKPETHYDLNLQDNGWWEGYQQQPIVIINEFRGEIKFNELLSLVDKWPKSVKRRCREPMPFTSTTVIITSAVPPEEVYKNSLTENDKLEQFYRRFDVVKL